MHKKSKKPKTWADVQKARCHYIAFELASLLHFMDEVQEANPNTPLLILGNGHNGAPPVYALEPFLNERVKEKGWKVSTCPRISSKMADQGDYVPDSKTFNLDGVLSFMLKENPIPIIVDNSVFGAYAGARLGFQNFLHLLNHHMGTGESIPSARPLPRIAYFDYLSNYWSPKRFPNFQGFKRLVYWSPRDENNPPGAYPVVKPSEVKPGDVVFTNVMVSRFGIMAKAGKKDSAAKAVLEAAGECEHRADTELSVIYDSALGGEKRREKVDSNTIIIHPIDYTPIHPLIEHYMDLFP
ncbi:MAG: hypothetical protein ABH851_04800 [Methanobacteriota archaeon]